jgi:uncharacterized Zn finger protein
MEENGGINCPDCNMSYKNQRCFIAHKVDKCKLVKKCLDCGKVVWLKKDALLTIVGKFIVNLAAILKI